MNTQRNPKLFITILLLLVLFLSYKILAPYLSLLVLAILTALMFNSVYRFFFKVFRKRSSFATVASMITVFLVFLIPLLFFIDITVQQSIKFYNDVTAYIEGNDVSFSLIIGKINSLLGHLSFINYHLTESEIKSTILTVLKPFANFIVLSIGGSVIEFIPKIIIFVFALAAFFPTYPKLFKYIKDLSPLDDKLDELYIHRIVAMATSMVKGTLIIALAQGLISGVALWLTHVPYPVFWTIVMIFLSIIPLGSGIISIPVGIVQILLGNIWQGIFIIVNHFLIVTNIDNVLRPRLVSKEAELPPILTLLGVVGGLKMFGFFGFIYGPVIMIFLVTTLEIYKKFHQKQKAFQKDTKPSH
jgi:predicted PurR-regulated permease PerM